MDYDHEHLKFDKRGEVDKVSFVNPFSGEQSADKWKNIDNIIRDYTQLHPNEMELHLLEVKHARNTRLNEYGSDRKKNIRWGMSIPVALMFKIEARYPQFFADKRNYNQFIKKYKGFRTCKII